MQFINPQKLNRLISYCLLLCLLISPGFVLGAGTVPLYGMYEDTINFKTETGNSHTFSDPFYGVELTATFTSPSGKKFNWFGFYDGNGNGEQSGDIWKIRFMPDEVGEWTYTWRFSSNGPSGSDRFTAVKSSAKPGPLRKDKKIPQWLVTANGNRHVFSNMNHAGLTSASFTNPKKAIGDTVKLNYDIHWISGPLHVDWAAKSKNANNPYIFMDTNNYIPRLQGWHYAENGLYKEAYNKNIYLYEFLGFYAGNKFYLLHKKPISFQNKVIKYWLARTAPNYIFLYNIGFELAEYVNVPSWPEERAKFIKSIDPWDHLVTGHELKGWNYGKSSSSIDFASLQNSSNLKKNTDFHKIALNVWNSPSKAHAHCNECIWTGTPWHGKGSEDSYRKDLWDGITGGMSYAYWAWENASNRTGSKSVEYANDFLKSGVKWWETSPHDEVVKKGKAYVLANIGKEYIVYSNSGSSFELKLPAGAYNQRWFNPASGKFNSKQSVLSKQNQSTIFDKPNSSDWVLHILSASSTNDTTAPAAPSNLIIN